MINIGGHMKIGTAIALEIGELNRPVVTSYQLGLIVVALYAAKAYRGKPLNFLKRELPQSSNFKKLIHELIKSGVLRDSPAISNKEVYAVLSQDTVSAEEIACCVDPFCYISHLSAMEYHGLTDRFPKVLFLSSPGAILWRQLAHSKMVKDLGESYEEYITTGLPKIRRLQLKKIAKKTVNLHTSVHYTPGAYISVKGKALRVSTMGRTFLDMIRDPSLCGGIYHVLDVYKEFAGRYLKLIVSEVEQHGNVIDKVRVGYILDERLGISNAMVNNWQTNVQRGGSRKLLAENPYVPIFSEKWGLSINIEETAE